MPWLCYFLHAEIPFGLVVDVPPLPAGSILFSSRFFMNHLRRLGLASFFFLGLGLLSGTLPRSATGWTPTTAAATALVCYCIGLILALVAFMQSRRGQSLDGGTKFLARGPLALITIGVLIFFLRAMTGWW